MKNNGNGRASEIREDIQFLREQFKEMIDSMDDETFLVMFATLCGTMQDVSDNFDDDLDDDEFEDFEEYDEEDEDSILEFLYDELMGEFKDYYSSLDFDDEEEEKTKKQKEKNNVLEFPTPDNIDKKD